MRSCGLLFLGMNRLGHNLSILNLPKLGLFFEYFREPRLVGVPVLWLPFRWASSRYILFGISAYTFSVSLEACSKAWICLRSDLQIKTEKKTLLHLWLIFSLCPTHTTHTTPTTTHLPPSTYHPVPTTQYPPTTTHRPPPQPEGRAGQDCSSLARTFPRQVALNLRFGAQSGKGLSRHDCPKSA